jgi:hypothetical protein
VPLTLVIDDKDGKRETIKVDAPVRSLTEMAKPMVHEHAKP